MTLFELMLKSGMLDVFDDLPNDVQEYAASTSINVSFDSERCGILGTERIGDDMTIVIDIDG